MAGKLTTLTLAGLLLAGCAVTNDQPPTLPQPTGPATSTSYAPPHPIAVEDWPKPDDRLTPGAVTPGCTYPRPKTQRDVTAATRRQVLAAYHYTGPTDITHLELDHRVPFALCGANSAPNLWVEIADGVHQSKYIHNRKDELELAIASKVRNHKMTLSQAQAVFLGDWRLGWCRYVKDPGVTC